MVNAMMSDVEQYKNLIELLKQALLFYADSNNYDKLCDNIHTFSTVEKDGGSQARFALDKIKEMIENSEKMENDYTAQINAAESLGDDELMETIKLLKLNTDQE